MRTDPALHFTTGDELVEASRVAMARASAAMGDWFEVVPKAPCAVEGTLTGAKAFYFPPAEDGSRGGTFFVNIADPSSWGTFELEAMAFHEGIPGHHLQLAIAGELPGLGADVPPARPQLGVRRGLGALLRTAHRRDGPLRNAGRPDRHARRRLDARLPGWSWTPACTRSAGAVSRRSTTCSRTPRSRRAWCAPRSTATSSRPGRRTSYMIGRLEIQRMRREAEQRQGEGFDGEEVPLRRARLRLAAARGARPGGEGAAALRVLARGSDSPDRTARPGVRNPCRSAGTIRVRGSWSQGGGQAGRAW